jgi:hypothetical protein
MGDLGDVPDSKDLVKAIDHAGQAIRQVTPETVDISFLNAFVLLVQQDPGARYNRPENEFNSN